VIVLDYLPQGAPLVAHVESRMVPDDTGEDASAADVPNEGESRGEEEQDESPDDQNR
jgi:hypothetical protein